MSIYGQYEPRLTDLLAILEDQIAAINAAETAAGRPKLYEHLSGRVKTPESMLEKCQRKGYPQTTEAALRQCKDAVGVRIVCNFIDDIYRSLECLKAAPWCTVVKEKDYITNAKPNGYRSYHLINHTWDDDDEEADDEDLWINVSYLRQKLQSVNSRVVITGEKGGPFTLTKP